MRYHALWVRFFWLAIFSLILASCQPQAPTTIMIIDGEQIHRLATNERIPANLLTEAGITLGPSDRLLVDGQRIPLDLQLSSQASTIQVCRAIVVTLVTPGGEQEISTGAGTVGEALQEAGIQLYAADFVDPPADASISVGMTISYRPAQELSITTSDGIVTIRSSAETIGAALAGAG